MEAVRDIGLETAGLAGDYVRRYGPSHGVDPIDALIAATAKTRNLELATLNLKHFPMIDTPKRPLPPVIRPASAPAVSGLPTAPAA